MYRHCYFDQRKNIIHQWTWDENGNRIKKEVPFNPFIYIPNNSKVNADAYGIDGTPLLRKAFKYSKEKNDFIRNYPNKIYFNLPPTQQFLLEKYHHVPISELTKNALKTFYYDIEVVANEFPDPQEAKFPITSITIFDSESKKFYVWGIKKYDEYSCKDHLKGVEPEEIVYYYCFNEEDLLKKFLRFWRKDFPDVLVGYNSFSFDLPYIVNRLEKTLGEGSSKKLSPVDYIFGKEVENKFKQKYTEYNLGGVSHLDYMVLYKTFTPGERESDSLDFVCFSELGITKLDFGDLTFLELCEQDWNKFVNYNIWDVRLLTMLEDRKHYLEIAKFSAFSGFCNLDKAFGKTSIITGVLAKQSLQKGQIISTQIPTDKEEDKIPGGYVKDPLEGLHEDVVSFDANSLYPSNIISLNISPETKVAKIIKETETDYTLFFFREKSMKDVPKNKMNLICKKMNWSWAPNNVFYEQKYKGIASLFCDELYNKRKMVKDEMLALKKKSTALNKESNEYYAIKKEIDQKDVEQYLYKILLNSTYGAFANKYFSLYDLDCATSITLSGQAMIKQTEKIVNEFLQKEWQLPPSDRVIFQDTDSCGVSVKDICSKYDIKLKDDKGELTQEFLVVENKIADHLNKEINDWAINVLNCADPRYFFKRESVCPKALFLKKKHYVLYIINKEGEKMNTFKYSGVRLAKSTLSAKVKDVSKKIVQAIMGEKDHQKANDMIFSLFEEFKTFDYNDIAERAGIKVLDKWENLNNEFECAKGTTSSAKASIYHNELLKQLSLQNKYKRIENSAKIKILYVKDNRFNIDRVAYQNELPKEFGLEPDYEQMFFKDVIKTLQPIYDALKWNMPDPKIQHSVSLESLFG